MNKDDSPIFIHSLWRSGSTYLFSCFRRSTAGFWCYQEPIHEIPLLNKNTPESLLQIISDPRLRHPPLDQPYYLELYETWKYWRDVISKPILYDGYFDNIGDDNLIKYLKTLIAHAKGRPVIQECRTSCRIATIKKALGGYHIYLWRNPWDQWWSYKIAYYFDITSQLILNASVHPQSIARLREEIGFAEFNDEDINKEFSYFSSNPLTSENSYLVFYMLWCLGLLEGMANADFLLNIDALSESPGYRDEILTQFLDSGITGVDFSDCTIPQAYYGIADKAFFVKLEDRVHSILLLSGYPQNLLTQMQELRQSREPKLWAVSSSAIPAERILSECTKAREIVRRIETENAYSFSETAKKLVYYEKAMNNKLNEEVVYAIYRNILCREPDSAGFDSWLSNLNEGTASITDFLSAALTSAEFKTNFPKFMRVYGPKDLPFTNDHSQHGEFFEILKLITDQGAPTKTVVDVGANGKERSNSYDLLKQFAWKGLLIEANPLLVDQINKDFQGLNYTLVNCAVSDVQGTGELSLGINSDISSLSPENTANWGPLSGSIPVTIRRLPDILTEQNIPIDFDVLSIDIEGYDARVLNDLIANSSYRPKIVIMEGSLNFTVNDPTMIGVSSLVCSEYTVVAQTCANLILSNRFSVYQEQCPA